MIDNDRTTPLPWHKGTGAGRLVCRSMGRLDGLSPNFVLLSTLTQSNIKGVK